MSVDNEKGMSLSTVLSRIPPQSPPLPEELLVTLLSPLITPHKDSRDHHLLLTSRNTTPTAQYIQNVLSQKHLLRYS
jgi:hypothetical protein